MGDPLGTGIRTIFGPNGPDMDPFGQRVSGKVLVAQAITKRLITKRGSLSWAPNVGYDVRALLNDSFSIATDAQLRAIAGYIRTEALADDRVSNAKVDLTFNASTRVMTINLFLTLSNETTFRFVVSANALTVDLLSVQ